MVRDVKLWRLAEVLIAGEAGKKKLQVSEVCERPLRRSMLEATGCFILSFPRGLCVWVGREASKGERHKALLYAQSFLQGKKLPMWTPLCRVVEGSEPSLFTCHFTDWCALPPRERWVVGPGKAGD